ncbi:MAG: hypothetical protein SGJ02_08085 [bacterium]|nr:hypothetical protein [bacterium]
MLLQGSSKLTILSIIFILSFLGCSTQKGGTRFRSTPFQTSFVDPEILNKISSLTVSNVQWAAGTESCLNREDLAHKTQAAFEGASTVKFVTLGNDNDARLNINVVSCEERIGSSFGSDRPARVGFLISIVNKESKELWSGTFSMKDTAILENLLAAPEKLKVGAKWLTSEEIMIHGLTLAAKEFETQRSRMFLEKPSVIK